MREEVPLHLKKLPGAVPHPGTETSGGEEMCPEEDILDDGSGCGRGSKNECVEKPFKKRTGD